MDSLQQFLKTLQQRKLIEGRLRGLFHLLIARKIYNSRGELIHNGMTWRSLAKCLVEAKYHHDLADELELDPAEAKSRDPDRFWYAAIMVAQPDSAVAREQAESIIRDVAKLGLTFGPAPLPTPPSRSSPPEKTRPGSATPPTDETEPPRESKKPNPRKRPKR